MQFSPKLKKAMEEIKVILKRHDIAAHVVLHTPGFSEYLLEIQPTYSCAKFEGAGIVRFKAKKEDFGDSAELRDQRIHDTINMFQCITETGGQNLLALISVTENFEKIIGIEKGDSSHTSHSTQNN